MAETHGHQHDTCTTVRPVGAVEDHDPAIVVRRDVRSGHRSERGECFTHVGVPPDTDDAEPPLASFREQPFVLAFFLRVFVVGELVEAIGDDETTPC